MMPPTLVIANGCRRPAPGQWPSAAGTLVILTVSMLLLLPRTHATLVFSDRFDYTAGQLSSVGSAKWDNGKSQITVANDSLSYGGLLPPVGNKVTLLGSTVGLDGTRTINETWSSTLTSNDGAMYFSFLLTVNATNQIDGVTGIPVVNISQEGGTSRLIAINLLYTNAGVHVGVVKYNSSSTAQSAAFFGSGNGAQLAVDGATTYLIVGKYEWVAGTGNDAVTVWVNPGGLGGSEDALNKVSTSAGADGTSGAGRFWISRGAYASLDDVRIGTTWADVTPTDGPAATTLPVITEALLMPEGMILRGSNGPASSAYQVIASTDIALPMTNWPAIATNVFDVAGNFDSTNPVAPAAARQFFRLLTGGTPPAGPTAPEIDTQPLSLTVDEGEEATFTVTATGTEPLSYQWYFNTNTALANATAATLLIPAAQTTNAGSYSVVVSNALGSVTSSNATLTVTAPTGPKITNEPVSQSAYVGQTAIFSVIATGAKPLAYQWYFNTNTILSAGTNASLMLSNVQTNNAGGYSVIVTNHLGSVTSVVATLTVNTNAFITPNFALAGFATLNGGTTGGAGGPTVTVSNFTGLDFYADNNSGPYIIQVAGTINLGGSNVRVRNNKTIIGLGTNATLVGDLKVDGNTNIIIRNLNFTNPNGDGDKDGLTLQDCRNIWVDHCTFADCADGSLDISHGADWITVSWCKFYYTNPGNTHRFVNLVGHSDSATAVAEDTGKLHVTFLHNWWSALCHERMPRVRFGRIHSYNNYFNAPGNNYCIRAARDSEVRLEGNYFLDVHNPWEVYITIGVTGRVYQVNNVTNNTSFSLGDDNKTLLVPGTDTVFVPPYSYTLDPTTTVPNTVTNNAGSGKGPYAP